MRSCETTASRLVTTNSQDTSTTCCSRWFISLGKSGNMGCVRQLATLFSMIICSLWFKVNIDWAGVMVERVTGQSLNEYFHRNIFEPLGLNNISMFPSASMKEKLAYMNQRDAHGHLSSRDHLLRRPLIVQTAADRKSCFNSGGAGCFAQPQEYCRMCLGLCLSIYKILHFLLLRRNPCYTAKQRHLTHHRQANPRDNHSRRDVPQSDPQPPQFCRTRHPSFEA